MITQAARNISVVTDAAMSVSPHATSAAPAAITRRAPYLRKARPAAGAARPMVTNIVEAPKKTVGSAMPRSPAMDDASTGRMPTAPQLMTWVMARTAKTIRFFCMVA